MSPLGVTLPTWLLHWSVNQTLPSLPSAAPHKQPPPGTLYSVTVPLVVILPTLPEPSTNQMLPSEPVVIPPRRPGLELIPELYSVIVPLGVILPILSWLPSKNQ